MFVPKALGIPKPDSMYLSEEVDKHLQQSVDIFPFRMESGRRQGCV